MAYCTQCSEPLRSGVQFCPHCGAVAGKAKRKRHVKKKERSNQNIKSSATSKKVRKQKQPRPGNIPKKGVTRRAFIIKAGAKSLGKSLALSAAILGPGLILLSLSYQIFGMIWLFLGSFGLMAWTYRKPWRLGLISCLLPPVAAALCYLLQLELFGSTAPPLVLLLPAIGIGVGVGYWRARAHEVKRDKKGGIIAQRTIGYLLVWVAAYGITQMLGLMAAGTFAVRAGLVTGAFSTAMLAMVSLVLWRQFKAFRATSTTSILVYLLFSPVLMAAFVNPVKAEPYPDEIINRVISQAGFVYKGRPFTTTLSDKMRDGYSKRDNSKVSLAARDLACKIDDYSGMKATVVLNRYESKGIAATAIKRMIDKAVKKEKATRYQAKYQPTRKIMALPAYASVVFQESPKGGRGGLFAHQGNWILGLRIEEFNDDGSRKAFVENYLVNRARSILRNLPSTSLSNPSGSSAGNNGGKPYTPPHDPGIDPETTAKVIAAVSAVLVAAGIAINVAQAIAAAIANALQSGVQFTTEEIQRAVVDAQLGDLPEPEYDPQPDYYDKEGEPFGRNDEGEYWAPDDRGNWRWLNEKDAQEAEVALRGENNQRLREREYHDRETQKKLVRSRQKIHTQNAAEVEAFKEHQRLQTLEKQRVQDTRERIEEHMRRRANAESGELKKETDELLADGNYAGLEDLYREKVGKEIVEGQETSAAERAWERKLAAGETVAVVVETVGEQAAMVVEEVFTGGKTNGAISAGIFQTARTFGKDPIKTFTAPIKTIKETGYSVVTRYGGNLLSGHRSSRLWRTTTNALWGTGKKAMEGGDALESLQAGTENAFWGEVRQSAVNKIALSKVKTNRLPNVDGVFDMGNLSKRETRNALSELMREMGGKVY